MTINVLSSEDDSKYSKAFFNPIDVLKWVKESIRLIKTMYLFSHKGDGSFMIVNA